MERGPGLSAQPEGSDLSPGLVSTELRDPRPHVRAGELGPLAKCSARCHTERPGLSRGEDAGLWVLDPCMLPVVASVQRGGQAGSRAAGHSLGWVCGQDRGS